VLDENPTLGEPTYVRNGAYAETVAFIQSLQGGWLAHPTPAEVLQTVELCEQIQQGAGP
jgi:hypothetical protein